MCINLDNFWRAKGFTDQDAVIITVTVFWYVVRPTSVTNFWHIVQLLWVDILLNTMYFFPCLMCLFSFYYNQPILNGTILYIFYIKLSLIPCFLNMQILFGSFSSLSCFIYFFNLKFIVSTDTNLNVLNAL